MLTRQPDYRRFDLATCYRCGKQGATHCPAAGVKLCPECTPPAEPEPAPPPTLPSPPQFNLPDLPDEYPDWDENTKGFLAWLQRGVIGPINPLLNLPVCRAAILDAYAHDVISLDDTRRAIECIDDLLEQL